MADDRKNGADSPRAEWRERIWKIIFEADTSAGKAFDVGLLIAIALSVLVVMLESVKAYHDAFGGLFFGLEWFFTLLFTAEYILRLVCVRRPLRYAKSFFGIVDLLSILPTYLSLFVLSSGPLIVVRVLRLLRLFRIFKMARYLGEANIIVHALRSSRAKIVVFLFGVLSLVIVIGTMMYLIEGEVNEDFSSIPRSVYWAIVTVTTVGYGDIAPETPLGQILASLAMLMGYAIIAVPTGIVGVEIQRQMERHLRKDAGKACQACGIQGHDLDARYCKNCGDELE